MREIVCLCGSTRFSKEFQEANLRETLAGRIVLTIGCDMKSDQALFAGKSEKELETIKENLDALHRSKIELAWNVLILNVDGYIGESTRREIEWAYECRKNVRWFEPQWVEVVSPIKFLNETIPVGALGIIHPEWDMIHYPEFPEPKWRSYGMDSLRDTKFISPEAKQGNYDVLELWLSDCHSVWIKERNSSEGENED
jgi:hypothetical protein